LLRFEADYLFEDAPGIGTGMRPANWDLPTGPEPGPQWPRKKRPQILWSKIGPIGGLRGPWSRDDFERPILFKLIFSNFSIFFPALNTRLKVEGEMLWIMMNKAFFDIW